MFRRPGALKAKETVSYLNLQVGSSKDKAL